MRLPFLLSGLADENCNGKYRDPSPFDYAQGQDDDVKQTTTSAKATATATTKYGDPSPFGFAQGQDDDVGGLNS